MDVFKFSQIRWSKLSSVIHKWLFENWVDGTVEGNPKNTGLGSLNLRSGISFIAKLFAMYLWRGAQEAIHLMWSRACYFSSKSWHVEICDKILFQVIIGSRDEQEMHVMGVLYFGRRNSKLFFQKLVTNMIFHYLLTCYIFMINKFASKLLKDALLSNSMFQKVKREWQL